MGRVYDCRIFFCALMSDGSWVPFNLGCRHGGVDIASIVWGGYPAVRVTFVSLMASYFPEV